MKGVKDKQFKRKPNGYSSQADQHGMTAMHYAAQNPNTRALKMLLSAGRGSCSFSTTLLAISCWVEISRFRSLCFFFSASHCSRPNERVRISYLWLNVARRAKPSHGEIRGQAGCAAGCPQTISCAQQKKYF